MSGRGTYQDFFGSIDHSKPRLGDEYWVLEDNYPSPISGKVYNPILDSLVCFHNGSELHASNENRLNDSTFADLFNELGVSDYQNPNDKKGRLGLPSSTGPGSMLSLLFAYICSNDLSMIKLCQNACMDYAESRSELKRTAAWDAIIVLSYTASLYENTLCLHRCVPSFFQSVLSFYQKKENTDEIVSLGEEKVAPLSFENLIPFVKSLLDSSLSTSTDSVKSLRSSDKAYSSIRDPKETVTTFYLNRVKVASSTVIEVMRALRSKSLIVPSNVDPVVFLREKYPMPPREDSFVAYRQRELFWDTAEIRRFNMALARHGKAFHLISRSVRTRSTQACTTFYYCLWRRTDSFSDYALYRSRVGDAIRTDRDLMRRERAWFHMWRHKEELLGPLMPPAQIPLPNIYRMPPAGKSLKCGNIIFLDSAANLQSISSPSIPSGLSISSSYVLPLKAPTIDVLVAPDGTSFSMDTIRESKLSSLNIHHQNPKALLKQEKIYRDTSDRNPSILLGFSGFPFDKSAEDTTRFKDSLAFELLGVAKTDPLGSFKRLHLRMGNALQSFLPNRSTLTDRIKQSAFNRFQQARESHELLDHDDIRVESESYCGVCGDGGELICCEGPCMRSFHNRCIDNVQRTFVNACASSPSMSLDRWAPIPGDKSREDWQCWSCISGESECFICGCNGVVGVDLFGCMKTCGKVYHIDCVAKWPQTVFYAPFEGSGDVQEENHSASMEKKRGRPPKLKKKPFTSVGEVVESSMLASCSFDDSLVEKGRTKDAIERDIQRKPDCCSECTTDETDTCYRGHQSKPLYGRGLAMRRSDYLDALMENSELSEIVQGLNSVPHGGRLSSISLNAKNEADIPFSSFKRPVNEDPLDALLREERSRSASYLYNPQRIAESLVATPVSQFRAESAFLTSTASARPASISLSQLPGDTAADLTQLFHYRDRRRPKLRPRFICPLHTCATCREPFDTMYPSLFFRCHACPSTFHAVCVPPDALRDMNEIVTCPSVKLHTAKRMSDVYRAKSGVSRLPKEEDQEALAAAAARRIEAMRENAGSLAAKSRIGDGTLKKLMGARSGTKVGAILGYWTGLKNLQSQFSVMEPGMPASNASSNGSGLNSGAVASTGNSTSSTALSEGNAQSPPQDWRPTLLQPYMHPKDQPFTNRALHILSSKSLDTMLSITFARLRAFAYVGDTALAVASAQVQAMQDGSHGLAPEVVSRLESLLGAFNNVYLSQVRLEEQLDFFELETALLRLLDGEEHSKLPQLLLEAFSRNKHRIQQVEAPPAAQRALQFSHFFDADARQQLQASTRGRHFRVALPPISPDLAPRSPVPVSEVFFPSLLAAVVAHDYVLSFFSPASEALQLLGGLAGVLSVPPAEPLPLPALQSLPLVPGVAHALPRLSGQVSTSLSAASGTALLLRGPGHGSAAAERPRFCSVPPGLFLSLPHESRLRVCFPAIGWMPPLVHCPVDGQWMTMREAEERAEAVNAEISGQGTRAHAGESSSSEVDEDSADSGSVSGESAAPAPFLSSSKEKKSSKKSADKDALKDVSSKEKELPSKEEKKEKDKKEEPRAPVRLRLGLPSTGASKDVRTPTPTPSASAPASASGTATATSSLTKQVPLSSSPSRSPSPSSSVSRSLPLGRPLSKPLSSKQQPVHVSSEPAVLLPKKAQEKEPSVIQLKRPGEKDRASSGKTTKSKKEAEGESKADSEPLPPLRFAALPIVYARRFSRFPFAPLRSRLGLRNVSPLTKDSADNFHFYLLETLLSAPAPQMLPQLRLPLRLVESQPRSGDMGRFSAQGPTLAPQDDALPDESARNQSIQAAHSQQRRLRLPFAPQQHPRSLLAQSARALRALGAPSSVLSEPFSSAIHPIIPSIDSRTSVINTNSNNSNGSNSGNISISDSPSRAASTRPSMASRSSAGSLEVEWEPLASQDGLWLSGPRSSFLGVVAAKSWTPTDQYWMVSLPFFFTSSPPSSKSKEEPSGFAERMDEVHVSPNHRLVFLSDHADLVHRNHAFLYTRSEESLSPVAGRRSSSQAPPESRLLLRNGSSHPRAVFKWFEYELHATFVLTVPPVRAALPPLVYHRLKAAAAALSTRRFRSEQAAAFAFDAFMQLFEPKFQSLNFKWRLHSPSVASQHYDVPKGLPVFPSLRQIREYGEAVASDEEEAPSERKRLRSDSLSSGASSISTRSGKSRGASSGPSPSRSPVRSAKSAPLEEFIDNPNFSRTKAAHLQLQSSGGKNSRSVDEMELFHLKEVFLETSVAVDDSRTRRRPNRRRMLLHCQDGTIEEVSMNQHGFLDGLSQRVKKALLLFGFSGPAYRAFRVCEIAGMLEWLRFIDAFESSYHSQKRRLLRTLVALASSFSVDVLQVPNPFYLTSPASSSTRVLLKEPKTQKIEQELKEISLPSVSPYIPLKSVPLPSVSPASLAASLHVRSPTLPLPLPQAQHHLSITSTSTTSGDDAPVGVYVNGVLFDAGVVSPPSLPEVFERLPLTSKLNYLAPRSLLLVCSNSAFCSSDEAARSRAQRYLANSLSSIRPSFLSTLISELEVLLGRGLEDKPLCVPVGAVSRLLEQTLDSQFLSVFNSVVRVPNAAEDSSTDLDEQLSNLCIPECDIPRPRLKEAMTQVWRHFRDFYASLGNHELDMKELSAALSLAHPRPLRAPAPDPVSTPRERPSIQAAALLSASWLQRLPPPGSARGPPPFYVLSPLDSYKQGVKSRPQQRQEDKKSPPRRARSNSLGEVEERAPEEVVDPLYALPVPPGAAIYLRLQDGVPQLGVGDSSLSSPGEEEDTVPVDKSSNQALDEAYSISKSTTTSSKKVNKSSGPLVRFLQPSGSEIPISYLIPSSSSSSLSSEGGKSDDSDESDSSESSSRNGRNVGNGSDQEIKPELAAAQVDGLRAPEYVGAPLMLTVLNEGEEPALQLLDPLSPEFQKQQQQLREEVNAAHVRSTPKAQSPPITSTSTTEESSTPIDRKIPKPSQSEVLSSVKSVPDVAAPVTRRKKPLHWRQRSRLEREAYERALANGESPPPLRYANSDPVRPPRTPNPVRTKDKVEEAGPRQRKPRSTVVSLLTPIDESLYADVPEPPSPQSPHRHIPSFIVDYLGLDEEAVAASGVPASIKDTDEGELTVSALVERLGQVPRRADMQVMDSQLLVSLTHEGDPSLPPSHRRVLNWVVLRPDGPPPLSLQLSDSSASKAFPPRRGGDRDPHDSSFPERGEALLEFQLPTDPLGASVARVFAHRSRMDWLSTDSLESSLVKPLPARRSDFGSLFTASPRVDTAPVLLIDGDELRGHGTVSPPVSFGFSGSGGPVTSPEASGEAAATQDSQLLGQLDVSRWQDTTNSDYRAIPPTQEDVFEGLSQLSQISAAEDTMNHVFVNSQSSMLEEAQDALPGASDDLHEQTTLSIDSVDSQSTIPLDKNGTAPTAGNSTATLGGSAYSFEEKGQWTRFTAPRYTHRRSKSVLDSPSLEDLGLGLLDNRSHAYYRAEGLRGSFPVRVRSTDKLPIVPLEELTEMIAGNTIAQFVLRQLGVQDEGNYGNSSNANVVGTKRVREDAQLARSGLTQVPNVVVPIELLGIELAPSGHFPRRSPTAWALAKALQDWIRWAERAPPTQTLTGALDASGASTAGSEPKLRRRTAGTAPPRSHGLFLPVDSVQDLLELSRLSLASAKLPMLLFFDLKSGKWVTSLRTLRLSHVGEEERAFQLPSSLAAPQLSHLLLSLSPSHSSETSHTSEAESAEKGQTSLKDSHVPGFAGLLVGADVLAALTQTSITTTKDRRLTNPHINLDNMPLLLPHSQRMLHFSAMSHGLVPLSLAVHLQCSERMAAATASSATSPFSNFLREGLSAFLRFLPAATSLSEFRKLFPTASGVPRTSPVTEKTSRTLASRITFPSEQDPAIELSLHQIADITEPLSQEDYYSKSKEDRRTIEEFGATAGAEIGLTGPLMTLVARLHSFSRAFLPQETVLRAAKDLFDEFHPVQWASLREHMLPPQRLDAVTLLPSGFDVVSRSEGSPGFASTDSTAPASVSAPSDTSKHQRSHEGDTTHSSRSTGRRVDSLYSTVIESESDSSVDADETILVKNSAGQSFSGIPTGIQKAPLFGGPIDVVRPPLSGSAVNQSIIDPFLVGNSIASPAASANITTTGTVSNDNANTTTSSQSDSSSSSEGSSNLTDLLFRDLVSLNGLLKPFSHPESPTLAMPSLGHGSTTPRLSPNEEDIVVVTADGGFVAFDSRTLVPRFPLFLNSRLMVASLGHTFLGPDGAVLPLPIGFEGYLVTEGSAEFPFMRSVHKLDVLDYNLDLFYSMSTAPASQEFQEDDDMSISELVRLPEHQEVLSMLEQSASTASASSSSSGGSSSSSGLSVSAAEPSMSASGPPFIASRAEFHFQDGARKNEKIIDGKSSKDFVLLDKSRPFIHPSSVLEIPTGVLGCFFPLLPPPLLPVCSTTSFAGTWGLSISASDCIVPSPRASARSFATVNAPPDQVPGHRLRYPASLVKVRFPNNQVRDKVVSTTHSLCVQPESMRLQGVTLPLGMAPIPPFFASTALFGSVTLSATSSVPAAADSAGQAKETVISGVTGSGSVINGQFLLGNMGLSSLTGLSHASTSTPLAILHSPVLARMRLLALGKNHRMWEQQLHARDVLMQIYGSSSRYSDWNLVRGQHPDYFLRAHDYVLKDLAAKSRRRRSKASKEKEKEKEKEEEEAEEEDLVDEVEMPSPPAFSLPPPRRIPAEEFAVAAVSSALGFNPLGIVHSAESHYRRVFPSASGNSESALGNSGSASEEAASVGQLDPEFFVSRVANKLPVLTLRLNSLDPSVQVQSGACVGALLRSLGSQRDAAAAVMLRSAVLLENHKLFEAFETAAQKTEAGQAKEDDEERSQNKRAKVQKEKEKDEDDQGHDSNLGVMRYATMPEKLYQYFVDKQIADELFVEDSSSNPNDSSVNTSMKQDLHSSTTSSDSITSVRPNNNVNSKEPASMKDDVSVVDLTSVVSIPTTNSMTSQTTVSNVSSADSIAHDSSADLTFHNAPASFRGSRADEQNADDGQSASNTSQNAGSKRRSTVTKRARSSTGSTSTVFRSSDPGSSVGTTEVQAQDLSAETMVGIPASTSSTASKSSAELTEDVLGLSLLRNLLGSEREILALKPSFRHLRPYISAALHALSTRANRPLDALEAMFDEQGRLRSPSDLYKSLQHLYRYLPLIPTTSSSSSISLPAVSSPFTRVSEDILARSALSQVILPRGPPSLVRLALTHCKNPDLSGLSKWQQSRSCRHRYCHSCRKQRVPTESELAELATSDFDSATSDINDYLRAPLLVQGESASAVAPGTSGGPWEGFVGGVGRQREMMDPTYFFHREKDVIEHEMKPHPECTPAGCAVCSFLAVYPINLLK